MGAVIGHFASRIPQLAAWLQPITFPMCPINTRDLIDILLTSLLSTDLELGQ